VVVVGFEMLTDNLAHQFVLGKPFFCGLRLQGFDDLFVVVESVAHFAWCSLVWHGFIGLG
jgi:hypothetical protein